MNPNQFDRRRLFAVGSSVAVAGGLGIQTAKAQIGKKRRTKKRDWASQEFRKLVALGESTTAGGWSTSRQRCWVSLLGELINDFQAEKMEVFNAGIGSNVISTMSPCYPHSGKPAADERLGKHVIGKKPDLLVVSYGLNDARGGTPVKQFKQSMANVVRQVRKKIQPLIVLLGPYYMTDFGGGGKAWTNADLGVFESYNRGIAEVARQERCLYVDLLSAYGNTDWMIHYDGIHANNLGHRIVANQIFQVLAQNCSGMARNTQRLERKSPRWRNESKLKADYGY